MKGDKVSFVEGRGFVQGVPTRDLEWAEWEALSEETKELCLSSGIYKFNNKPAKPELAKAGE